MKHSIETSNFYFRRSFISSTEILLAYSLIDFKSKTVKKNILRIM